jgi:hypothetical protein
MQSALPAPSRATVTAVLEAAPVSGVVIVTCPYCGNLHSHHAATATRLHACPADDGSACVLYSVVVHWRRRLRQVRRLMVTRALSRAA